MLTQNKQLTKKCKPILDALFKKDIDSYIDLFFYEKGVENFKGAKTLQKAISESYRPGFLLQLDRYIKQGGRQGLQKAINALEGDWQTIK